MSGNNSENPKFNAVLTILGGLLVAVLCGRHVVVAVLTGETAGRMGAIHLFPSASFFVSVFGGLLGLAMGLGVVCMAWRWTRS